ncbi:hypothetical protein [Pseudophaeobacter sp.]|uniref:hypothetical protein n=1 Tax=Pseudophaeobacter sp. TaxID=1971739 RepID=UPI00329680E8
MFEPIAVFYTQAFAVILPATATGLVVLGAKRAGLSQRRTALAAGLVVTILGLWYAIVVPLAKTGILMPPVELSDPPYALMPLLGGATLLWLLGRGTQTGRQVLSGLDHSHLIAFQSFRLMGGIFLLGWAMGAIPWQFALPAGLGDIMAGLAAIKAHRALARGDVKAEALVRQASLIGLADFVIAVSLGIVTSAGALQLMAFDNPNVINAYPLALFPEFFVPIFIAFQLFSLRALRHDRRHFIPA